MSDWYKLTAALFPPRRWVKSEPPTTTTDERVERLVGRFDTHNETVNQPPSVSGQQLLESESQTFRAEDKIETLANRVGEPKRTPNELARRSSLMLTIAVASQKGGAGKTTIA